MSPGVEFARSTTPSELPRFSLPADRIGDIVAISTRDTVIGTRAENHDLSALDVPLRSHGGLSEGKVPMLLNRPTTGIPQDGSLNNYDIFDVALNRV